MLPECRRKTILSHFGEILPQTYICNKCDNCEKHDLINKMAINNLQYPIYIIIKTVFLIKCKFGIGKLCSILRGSKSKTINEFFKIATYGLLKDITDEQVKCIINILIINNMLREKTITGGFGIVLETTSNSVQYYVKINAQAKNLKLTYDELYSILNKESNKLELKIPSEYADLIKIKYKTSTQELLDEFEIDDY